ncbi:hypothetical protein EPUL_003134 [Erysiphe pulchra]|uniref:CRAL-TRIO domain-containing protein n=1 Tax=Erysiphe pulchra TaxID=225359 RepID=A0A2S4PPZ8_9PEZI|nr:hypothetical protein EPUL_003134 [Erysiphe pulchra]
MAGPMKTPFSEPIPSARPLPEPVLDEDHKSKYDILLKLVKSWKEIPSESGKGGPVTEDDIFWLTRECLLRYLRATKWNVVESEKRLLKTLSWRRDFGVDNITADSMSVENETGKQILLGYDNHARPCYYLFPKNQNTTASQSQAEHVVFMIERGIDLMGPGQETLMIVVDFNIDRRKIPSIGQSKLILDIIQNHYPERLGMGFVLNAPWAVTAFFKIMSPFMDPFTRNKLNFSGDLKSFVPREQLYKEFMGELDFQYDHNVYWPYLNKLCEERRTQRRERWIQAGKMYGERETYLKGDGPSVGQ